MANAVGNNLELIRHIQTVNPNNVQPGTGAEWIATITYNAGQVAAQNRVSFSDAMKYAVGMQKLARDPQQPLIRKDFGVFIVCVDSLLGVITIMLETDF